MRHILCFQFLMLMLFSLVFSSPVTAVTINASPSPATTGQNITVTVISLWGGAAAGCYMQVDFGDGSSWVNLNPPCTGTTTCTLTTNHIYNNTGTYQLQARLAPNQFNCMNLTPPITNSTTLNITAPVVSALIEIDLPDGVVGMDYEYELGDRTGRYQLLAGRMAPGLKIILNQIKGVPVQEGKYRFQIRETDSSGTTTDTWYNLKITKALLSVTPDPKKITLDRNRASSFTLTYLLKSSAELDDTITSRKGIFLAGNRTLGTVNRPLTVQMTKGRAQVKEQVTIPLNVIKTAQRMGIDQIRYQRTFTARYMDAATTSSTAITVGTGFTFTRIRITFLDHTTKKFVKRNEKIDGAQVELAYEGAGLLKGYWQVDDRILARITKNLPFANSRTITLKLPQVPPLPTYSVGSHRLCFVITNPAMDISFPQIIYIVTGDDLSKTHPIHLLSPRDGITIANTDLTFTWKPRHDVATYQFEILKKLNGKTETIFSAYTKKAAYSIPARIAEKKFGNGGTWQWRIIGLNQDNKPVAASMERSFTVEKS